MTMIKIPILQLAAIVETLLLYKTNAFTIPSLHSNPLYTTTARTTSIRVQQSLYVKQKSPTQGNNKEPLFKVIDNDDDNDLFQINYNVDDDNDDDEEYDDYIDQGQSYTLDYDDDNDDDFNDNNNDSYKQKKQQQLQKQQEEYDVIYTPTKYSRDDDFILSEREDRLFVNEKGEKLELKEKCILVAVEDVTALRKNNRNMQKYNDNIMINNMDFDESSTSMNPEEWSVYFTLEESMNEMKDLIRTCGMELVGQVTQRLNEVNPKTYIGTGKVKETLTLLDEMDSCTVVFDAELTPGQQKHLENAFNKKVIQNDFMGSEQIVSCFRF